MRGIKLSHGVAFVECDGITVRINADGKCDLSPIQLPSLEWDLRTEPPSSWDYLTKYNIDAFDEDIRRQITQIVARVHDTLGE